MTGSYDYDAQRRRIRKVTSTGEVVIFVYDLEGQLLGEYDQTGKALREYVWLDNIPVAMFMPDPANASNPSLVFYIHADHLNAPRIVVDQPGAKRWRWIAEPFGTTAPETNPDGLGAFTQNLRFPGQYADAESGLFYNYFRFYAPEGGAYRQSDPIGFAGGSISTYPYVDGNPLTGSDAMGLANGGAAQIWMKSRSSCGRSPDFVNFQIDAFVGSVWGTFTRDGNSFVGAGLTRGFMNPLTISASTSVGWINAATISHGQTNNFVSGYAGSANATYLGVGGGVVASPGNGTATVFGVGAGRSYGSGRGYGRSKDYDGSGGNFGGAVTGGYSLDMGSTGLSWGTDNCSCKVR